MYLEEKQCLSRNKNFKLTIICSKINDLHVVRISINLKPLLKLSEMSKIDGIEIPLNYK